MLSVLKQEFSFISNNSIKILNFLSYVKVLKYIKMNNCSSALKEK